MFRGFKSETCVGPDDDDRFITKIDMLRWRYVTPLVSHESVNGFSHVDLGRGDSVAEQLYGGRIRQKNSDKSFLNLYSTAPSSKYYVFDYKAEPALALDGTETYAYIYVSAEGYCR